MGGANLGELGRIGANWGELGRIGAKWDGAGGAGREGMGAYVGVGGYTGGIRDGLQGSLWGGGTESA